MLGRGPQRGMVPGNADLIDQVNGILEYDFTPFLADIWYNNRPGSEQKRIEYFRTVIYCYFLNNVSIGIP